MGVVYTMGADCAQIWGRWGSGAGRVSTEYDGVRRTLTGGFLFLGDLAGFGRVRGVTIGANHRQELYGR